MRKVICPGSFDPVTNGHLDIFLRASVMVDEIIVAVFHNPIKGKAMFSVQERVEMLKECTRDIANVRVDSFSGLLHEYVRREGANAILRGLRALTDFEYEFQRALMIKKLDPNIETIFIMTKAEYSFLSSTGVREILAFGGSVKNLVPACLEDSINDKFKNAKFASALK
ncbi:MAG: pantetheine-phosphate adenylyltransferase [Acidaminococcales bacterium]|nr:pantetheine-phosphate adenylyltransferase [Acidaminococcales bacterium]